MFFKHLLFTVFYPSNAVCFLTISRASINEWKFEKGDWGPVAYESFTQFFATVFSCQVSSSICPYYLFTSIIFMCFDQKIKNNYLEFSSFFCVFLKFRAFFLNIWFWFDYFYSVVCFFSLSALCLCFRPSLDVQPAGLAARVLRLLPPLPHPGNHSRVAHPPICDQLAYSRTEWLTDWLNMTDWPTDDWLADWWLTDWLTKKGQSATLKSATVICSGKPPEGAGGGQSATLSPVTSSRQLPKNGSYQANSPPHWLIDWFTDWLTEF